MAVKMNKGALAESLVCCWLLFKGYRICARRLRVYGVEVDVVAKKGCSIVLVEVKCRSGGFYGIHHEQKSRQLRVLPTLIERFSAENGRWDVVVVQPRWPFVLHYKNAAI